MMAHSTHQLLIIALLLVVILIILSTSGEKQQTRVTIPVTSSARKYRKPPPSRADAEGFPSPRMIEVYKSQAQTHRDMLKKVLDNKSADHTNLYENIVPEAICEELVRIGTTHDGGKWMCSPHELPLGCNILSLGLFNAISFDEQLQRLTDQRCKLIGFDKDEQKPEMQKILNSLNAYSKKAMVGSDVTKGHKTIKSLMQQENVTKVEILKIDIEDGEFSALIPFLQEYTVSQIMIEIHNSRSSSGMIGLLNEMAKLNYWMIFYEINGGAHTVSEFTLMHQSAFQRYKAHALTRYLDF